MREPVEHQSIYPGGHDDWRPGLTCDECTANHEANLAKHKTVNVDIGFQLGFTHPSPTVQEFVNTGDPEVFGKGRS